MRWHFVGGIFATLFGLFYVAVGLLMLGTMAYYNIRYGPIEYSHGRHEALDQIALTPKNITNGISTLGVGIGMSAAAYCWFKQKKRDGTILFLLSLALAGITAAVIRNM
ncbi:hypothetical protein [Gimesia panareensis]|uniref:hypothetical protein n=1 Tax=Gimesia panareensis TaxID=2527978 RepID=UPI00118A9F9B|nr:hypothetical protein [Gimesia panareensis]QDU51231.1 hypothetical protein Pan110_35950 [Gimesia panareensis]